MTREEAITRMRTMPTRLYVLTTSVSRSGMSRKVRVFCALPCEREDPILMDVTGICATIYFNGRRRPGAPLNLRGCGMDMHFHLVDYISGECGRRFVKESL